MAANESIFRASVVQPLVLRYQKALKAGREDEALELLDQIIRESIKLIEAIARSGGFTVSADWPSLFSDAMKRLCNAARKFRPNKGSIHSYFSRVVVNTLTLTVNKSRLWRSRNVCWSDMQGDEEDEEGMDGIPLAVSQMMEARALEVHEPDLRHGYVPEDVEVLGRSAWKFAEQMGYRPGTRHQFDTMICAIQGHRNGTLAHWTGSMAQAGAWYEHVQRYRKGQRHPRTAWKAVKSRLRMKDWDHKSGKPPRNASAVLERIAILNGKGPTAQPAPATAPLDGQWPFGPRGRLAQRLMAGSQQG